MTFSFLLWTPIVESVGGGEGAVFDRKLEMNPKVMHNTNPGVDQGFILKLPKPWTPEILLERYFNFP